MSSIADDLATMTDAAVIREATALGIADADTATVAWLRREVATRRVMAQTASSHVARAAELGVSAPTPTV